MSNPSNNNAGVSSTRLNAIYNTNQEYSPLEHYLQRPETYEKTTLGYGTSNSYKAEKPRARKAKKITRDFEKEFGM